jgi:hypothetical protein
VVEVVAADGVVGAEQRERGDVPAQLVEPDALGEGAVAGVVQHGELRVGARRLERERGPIGPESARPGQRGAQLQAERPEEDGHGGPGGLALGELEAADGAAVQGHGRIIRIALSEGF